MRALSQGWLDHSATQNYSWACSAQLVTEEGQNGSVFFSRPPRGRRLRLIFASSRGVCSPPTGQGERRSLWESQTYLALGTVGSFLLQP